ncbi:MAG: response regulator transcription factor [Flavobacteriales bacterium]|nr:response regulator transcription factor [Flavobacteriales bacterium]
MSTNNQTHSFSSIQIALADDHVLLRRSLSQLLTAKGFNVVFEADDGEELILKIKGKSIDLVLMDVSMPNKDGIQTTLWLKENRPEVKVLALSMSDDELTIIRMIRAGAGGYVLKDIEPEELSRAIYDVVKNGTYYSEMVSGKIMNGMRREVDMNQMNKVNLLGERELEFIRLACTDLSYKEIAKSMEVSPRTVDGYRESVFNKLKMKTRIGLVLYVFKNKVIVF